MPESTRRLNRPATATHRSSCEQTVVKIKAPACELPRESGLPLSRYSNSEIASKEQIAAVIRAAATLRATVAFPLCAEVYRSAIALPSATWHPPPYRGGAHSVPSTVDAVPQAGRCTKLPGFQRTGHRGTLCPQRRYRSKLPSRTPVRVIQKPRTYAIRCGRPVPAKAALRFRDLPSIDIKQPPDISAYALSQLSRHSILTLDIAWAFLGPHSEKGCPGCGSSSKCMTSVVLVLTELQECPTFNSNRRPEGLRVRSLDISILA